MKKITGLLACLSAGVMLISGVGCGLLGGDDDDGDKTVLEFWQYEGCSGRAWSDAAIERFQEQYKDKVYEAGKQGVKVNLTYQRDADLTNPTYDIYMLEGVADIYALSVEGKVLDLADLFTDEENGYENLTNKLKPEVMNGLLGYNPTTQQTSYYSLPWYEWYPGVAYDVDYFNEENLYFADPTETNTADIPTEYGTAHLISSANGKKSVGPNGIRGDYDDGLPSSIDEFMQLCAVIKFKGDNPFLIGGDLHSYSFFLVEAMWAALSGANELQTIYSLDSKGQEVEVVKRNGGGDGDYMLTTEPLFPNATNPKVAAIMKPQTERIVITEDNGYRIYDMTARYYALAVFEALCVEQWYNTQIYANGSYSNTQTQRQFYYGDKATNNLGTGAMMYDASYWYSEAVRANTVSDYTKRYGDRHVSFMPMPSQLTGSVTEGNGKANTLLDVGHAQLFANGRITSEGKKQAAKDFLAFLYSNDELKAFTEGVGLLVPVKESLNYYDKSKLYDLGDYYSRMDTIRDASDVVYFATESSHVRGSKVNYTMAWRGPINRPQYDGRMQYYFELVLQYNQRAADIMKLTRKSASGW